MTIQEFRGILRRLDPASLAALLHELGFELYRRELSRWRVCSDLADELMDQATYEARVKLAGSLSPRATSSPRARRQRSRRRAS